MGPPFRQLFLFRHCYCVYFNRALLRQTFVAWLDDVDCDYGKKQGIGQTYIYKFIEPNTKNKIEIILDYK